MKKLFSLLLILTIWPVVAFSAEDLQAQADAAWAGREDPAQAMLALNLFEKIAAQNSGDNNARIRLAEAAYWVVEQDDYRQKLSADDKAALADKGVKACREILQKDEDHLAANYWLMWNMAASTLNKGIFSGFAFKDSIVCTIMVSKADINFQYGGVWRYWARVIFEIPGLLGRFFHFTDDDTVWLYQRAIAVEPNYLRNRFWLAESYERMDKKELAKKEYEFCANLKDDAVPSAVPENRLYKQWAKERLEKM